MTHGFLDPSAIPHTWYILRRPRSMHKYCAKRSPTHTHTHTHTQHWEVQVPQSVPIHYARRTVQPTLLASYNSRPHAACICQVKRARHCDREACQWAACWWQCCSQSSGSTGAWRAAWLRSTHTHLEGFLVYMCVFPQASRALCAVPCPKKVCVCVFPSVPLKRSFLVYTKPLFCLLRHLSFQSWKRLWCYTLFPPNSYCELMRGSQSKLRRKSKLVWCLRTLLFTCHSHISENSRGLWLFPGSVAGSWEKSREKSSRKRAEYCCESTVSEMRTRWASLSFMANSVSSLSHTNKRLRRTHLLFPPPPRAQ